VPETPEQNQTPNLIFYEVLTGQLDTGQEVLVQIFRKPDGKITLAQLAFRADSWQSWGVPIRLQHISSTPTTGGAA
jgi:hypothetical protein